MRVWWFTPGGTPVVVLEAARHATTIRDRVAAAGLEVVPAFYGHTPAPRPPRVGFTVTATELRLDDESAQPVVRVPRDGVDEAWLDAALTRKGTLTYVTAELAVEGDDDRTVADAVHAAAERGEVLGGIVGIARERPTLPLSFLG